MTQLESVFAGGPWPGVALVQVTLVALLGLLAWLAARRGGPALRGAVLLAALVGLLVVPGLAAVAPVWLPLPEFAWLADSGPAARVEDRGSRMEKNNSDPRPSTLDPRSSILVFLAEPPGKLPAGLGDPGEPLDELLRPQEDVELDDALSLPLEAAAPPVPTGEPPRRPWSLAGVLAVVWLLGALACLTRALARLALLYRWARRARPVRSPEWTACLKSLAERYGLPPVALRESPAVPSPLTLGLFRPVILLPMSRRTWSAEQQALILAHELAHVRRRDFLAGLVAELAACLCWFHPLVRWLAGRLRLEQEYTADAWAVSAANDAMNYVRCLARMALELSQEHGSLAPAFWRRRPEIFRRIDMLRRNPHGHSPRLGKGTAWTVAVLAAAAYVAVAGVGPLHSAAEALPPAEAAAEVKAPATTDLHGDPLPAGALARLGTTRWRHGATITFVTFGSDGKTLITAGQDNTVRLWDLATGTEIRRFAAPKPEEGKPPLPGKNVLFEKVSLDGEKAQLEAVQVQLKSLLQQQAKLVERKPLPVGLPGKKVPLDAEKAELEVKKAELEADKVKLEAVIRQKALMANDMSGLSVALTPDGRTLAIASGNVLQLWEVETGKELRKITGPATGLAGLLFSPDGRTLAARSADGTLLRWEAETGKEIHRIKAPQRPEARELKVDVLRGGGETSGMAFTPDGKALAVAVTEVKEQAVTSSVKFWDVATGKETQQIKGPVGIGISAVAFAPGGNVLAYGAANIIYLCEPDTGKELRQIKSPDGVQTLVFSPDGQALLVRGRSQQVRVWETETGKELYQLGDPGPVQPRGGVILARRVGFSGPEVRNLAFSPDGKQIATTLGGTVRLWEAATGKELPLSGGHQGPPAAVALSPDGQTVVSWGADRMIRRWEAATGKPLGAFQGQPGTTFAAFAADGQTVALANTDNTIRLHDTATGKELHRLKGHANGTSALAFAPDGRVLAARGGDGSIRLYDVAKGSDLGQLTAPVVNNPAPGGVVAIKIAGRIGGEGGTGLVFAPDGKMLAATGPSSFGAGPRSARGTIVFYDLAAGKPVRTIEPPQSVVSFAFSPDGRVLATENADQSITLWEVASVRARAQLGRVAATPPPTGAKVAFALVAGGGPVSAEPAGPVTLAFSPDGRALVARGPDLAVRIWDVAAGKEVRQLKGHEGRVETIAFGPGGKAIVSGSADTTILLWDATALRNDFPRATESLELADGAVEALWGDLASEDAGKALQGVLQLAGAPQQAVPFLAGQLKPAVPVDPQTVARWIADLESEKFAVRQAAAANLAKTGEQVVPALQQVLRSQPTIETRKRAEELLDKLIGGTLTPSQLRLVRALEALERMGTPEARELLRTLAQGAPGALPTRQAQAALDRLH